ncbi:MAG: DUF177 domain-containing protein [Nitrospiraceae bacterium]|nr:MAG: DUF177 domain-containing protein [Nitrospiraceae bacterium]
MKLNVSSIPEEGLQLEIQLSIPTGDNQKPDIADVSARIFRFGKRVLIEGTIGIGATLQCSRCLKEFALQLKFDFREEYLPAEDSGREDERELAAEDLDLGYFSDDELNIDEIVREQILLAVPIKPLCAETCKGLCRTCGKDLNEGGCECKHEETDPRLAPLRKIRESIK